MSKFTSGEWKFLEWPMTFADSTEQWYLVGSPERAVGFIRHEEDAKLIVAASEMYDELYEVLQLLQGKSSYDGDEYSQHAEDIRELLACIDGKEATHEGSK